VVVDFEKALSGDPCEDVPLLGGDMIIVPKRVATVDVVGQVVDPGEVEHVPGKRFRYYIRQAGGYASDARANRVKVIKSGTSSRLAANRVGTLEPGDVIWVPERVETDWWKLVREAAGLLTSVITAYVVIDQATGD
jgi:protein involved in polysaccharide export with SLBB domain